MKDLRLAAGYRAPTIMTCHDSGAYKDMARLTTTEMAVYRCWKDGETLKGTRKELALVGCGHVGIRTIQTLRLTTLAKLGASNIVEAMREENARGVRI